MNHGVYFKFGLWEIETIGGVCEASHVRPTSARASFKLLFAVIARIFLVLSPAIFRKSEISN